jgi:Aerotolerance regulator N-terminal
MIWLNPAAWLAIAAVAAPILIHLLIQRRAERLLFPTLRFLQPTRLASVRRHLLEDAPLLAIRVSLLAAAIAALAGPLLMTVARREAWDRRTVRAIVAGAAIEGDRDRAAGSPAPYLEQTFASASIADGVRRATLWLQQAPPARREIVIASAFPIGSITQADIDAIPANIGIRFERTGTLPTKRTVAAGRLLTAGGAVDREVTLERDRTSISETLSSEALSWPIDVVSSPADRTTIEAAIAAVRSQRVWALPADRRARLVLTPTTNAGAVSPKPIGEGAVAISTPWIADAVATITVDRDLSGAAARVTTGLSEKRFTAVPWQALAFATDGRPLAAAAGSTSGLLVVSAAPAADVATPVLLRAMANAIAAVPDLRSAEVMQIADAVRQGWSRPAAPVSSPRIDTIDHDDRGWVWLMVLALLALEMWVRRSRAVDERRPAHAEDARVA